MELEMLNFIEKLLFRNKVVVGLTTDGNYSIFFESKLAMFDEEYVLSKTGIEQNNYMDEFIALTRIG